MREPVLKAVASPPKILWGPFLPVLLNLGVQFPIMFVSIGAFEINPIIFVASMIQAFGQTYRVTKNLYKTKGNKFAP